MQLLSDQVGPDINDSVGSPTCISDPQDVYCSESSGHSGPNRSHIEPGKSGVSPGKTVPSNVMHEEIRRVEA